MKLAADSPLRTFLPDDQIALVEQTYYLLNHAAKDKDNKFEDYSFTIFPLGKAYEGFLKAIFMEAGYISRQDFLSKFFRIGKAMSPNLRRRLGKGSVYEKICQRMGCDISEMIWNAWKRGRNQTFHYFPDNVQAVTLQEAEDITKVVVATMETVVEKFKFASVQQKLAHLSMGEAKRLRSEKEQI